MGRQESTSALRDLDAYKEDAMRTHRRSPRPSPRRNSRRNSRRSSRRSGPGPGRRNARAARSSRPAAGPRPRAVRPCSGSTHGDPDPPRRPRESGRAGAGDRSGGPCATSGRTATGRARNPRAAAREVQHDGAEEPRPGGADPHTDRRSARPSRRRTLRRGTSTRPILRDVSRSGRNDRGAVVSDRPAGTEALVELYNRLPVITGC